MMLGVASGLWNAYKARHINSDEVGLHVRVGVAQRVFILHWSKICMYLYGRHASSEYESRSIVL